MTTNGDEMILLNKLARDNGVKPGTARAAARRGLLKAQLVETEVGITVWKATPEDFAAWKESHYLREMFGYLDKRW